MQFQSIREKEKLLPASGENYLKLEDHGARCLNFWRKMIADLEFYTQPNYQPSCRRNIFSDVQVPQKVTSCVFFLREL